MFADSKLELRDLLPNTSYVFKVQARNAVGDGAFVSVPVTTLPPRKWTSVVFCMDYTCFFLYLSCYYILHFIGTTLGTVTSFLL